MTVEERLELLPELLVLVNNLDAPHPEGQPVCEIKEISEPVAHKRGFWDQQWVICAPPLPVHNRFSCLEDKNETPGVFPIQTEELIIVAPEILPSLPKTQKSHQICLQKWEK